MNRIAMTLAVTTFVLGAGCSAYRDRLAETAQQGRYARYDEQGNIYQVYEYYPDQGVYRSVYGGTWHWQTEGGSWKRSALLPEQFDVADATHELVELPTSSPGTQHERVAQAHPSIDTLRAEATSVQDEHYIGTDQATAFASVPTDSDE